MSVLVLESLLQGVGPRRALERDVRDPDLRRSWQQALERALGPGWLEEVRPGRPGGPTSVTGRSPGAHTSGAGAAGPGTRPLAALAPPLARAAALLGPAPLLVAGAEPVRDRALLLVRGTAPARSSGWAAQPSPGVAPSAPAGLGASTLADLEPLAPGAEIEPSVAAPEPDGTADSGATPDPDPLRWHVEWTAEGVRVWLAESRTAAASLPLSEVLLPMLRRACAERGARLLSFVRNGETIWRETETEPRVTLEGGVERGPSKS